MNDLIKHYGINKLGIDYAVGDIHGTYTRLQERLGAIGFDPKTDRLFVPGDLVDRGKENELVLEWLDKPWFNASRGNHDQMAIDYVNGMSHPDMYRANGGQWFMNLDHNEETGMKDNTKQLAIAKAFEALPFAMTVDTKDGKIGLIHADPVCNDWDKLEASIDQYYVQQAALWERSTAQNGGDAAFNATVKNIRAVICGHTPFKAPQHYGNVFFIDTGAVFGHEFTILRLDTLEYV